MEYPQEVTETKTIRRITFRQVVEDVASAFNVERGLIYTIKNLVIRPGNLIREYLEDGRYRIFNPVRLLVLTTALSLFAAYITGFGMFIEDFASGYNTGKGEDAMNVKEAQQLFFDWYNLILWMYLPVASFLSFNFFQKSGYNYAENLVMHIFYLSIWNVFSTIIFLILPGQDDASLLATAIIGIILFFFYYIDFFKVRGIKAIVKITLCYGLSYVLYSVLSVLFIGLFLG